MQLNFSVPFNTQTDASGTGVLERDGKVREKRKKASGRCQQETSPEGDTVLSGAAGAYSHQMDLRLFQVSSAWVQNSA